MSRTILDSELRSWEAYATTGDYGLTAPAKIAFRCTSDSSQRPRIVDFEGDKSDAERAVRAAVRIQVDIPGGSSTGSGSIIDRRGYVLTNFHVVGFTRHGEHGGLPGALLGDGQRVQIAMVPMAPEADQANGAGEG